MSALRNLLGGGGPSSAQLALQRQQLAASKKAAEPQGASPESVVDPVAEAARRARLAALNRKGRASTILGGSATQVTPSYSNTVLGG